MFRFAFITGLGLNLVLAAQAQGGKVPISTIESQIRSQQYDQALSTLRAELREDPADFKLWTLEGICFGLRGNDAQALASFDHAIHIAPNYTPALEGEIKILYKTRDRRAIPLLERLVKSDSSNGTAHEMLGTLQKDAGDCRAAGSQFLLVKDEIASHPDSLEAYGYCLVKLDRTNDAIAIFRQLITLLPGRTYPSYDLAVLLVSTKNNNEAVKVLEPLLTPDQDDPDILSLASQAYEATGNTPKAVELQRQAIVLDPRDPSNYVAFATLCLSHDSFSVGIDMLDAGLKHVPYKSSLYLSRGVLYVQMGEYDKAESDFRMAEQLDTTQSLGAYAGDLAALEENNPEKALEQVRAQLKADSESSLLRLLLAKLLMNRAPSPESPAFKEAMRDALTVEKSKPQLVDAHNLLAAMYMSLSEYGRAIKECDLALQYDPSNENATYHLLLSLRHAGHSNDELQALSKRLAELHQESMHRETENKRYRLVEAEAPGSAPDAAH